MGEKEKTKYYDKKDLDKLKLHFVYVSIILGVFALLTLSYTFFDREVAWQFLSFAGVALSLVLSVIAILITLIDVAGQKQQVYEIFKSSEELKDTITKQQELIAQHAKNIDNVDDIIQNAFENHFDSINELSSNGEQETLKQEKDSGLKTEVRVNGKSTLINSNLFVTSFKTFHLNKELDSKQEDDIEEKINQFRTIEVRFDKSKVYLKSNYLYTNPMIDKEYEKNRSTILVERYLKDIGALSST
ncbi:Uncharacterised protein [Staphylococcus xylosus]|uniref:hypothetical protein n=1 Tax=Staphylococcus xylosus TaxID=1288 RepID=UPI00085C75F6|nr:hypothetical protein [Staphylococcus xylosus]SCU31702.1 Uncharacterised protein [Staphylococcus xylosus]